MQQGIIRLIILFLLITAHAKAFADDTAELHGSSVTPETSEPAQPALAPASSESAKHVEVAPDDEKQVQKKPPRGRAIREKEAEGTQAPKRFDTEVRFQSQYKFHGQPLDVDTD